MNADWMFLDQIRQPPFSIGLPVPAARHPLVFTEKLTGLAKHDGGHGDLDALGRAINNQLGAGFQLPGLIRIYSRLTKARVAGLSVAKDFNQIVEILMCNDLEEQSTGAMHPGLLIPHERPWLQEQGVAVAS